jgi:hypothetical protein
MDNQGKRPDQTKTNEKIVFYCFVGMAIVFLIQVVIDMMK